MQNTLLVDIGWAGALVCVITAILIWRRHRRLPLPPGPPPRWIVGNVRDMPREHKYKGYHELNKKYGDVVHLTVLGQPIILLGTHEVAVDLLEKPSAKYSDRRLSVMAQLTDFTWFFAINPYGSQWRKARKAFYEAMNPNAVAQYREVEERAVQRYLLRLLNEPSKFRENALYMFNATIIAVAYGLDVHAKPENDKYIQIAEQTMKSFNYAFTLGRYHVETFPIIRHFPAWFPLAKFKYHLPEWIADSRRLRDEPWDAAVEAMHQGNVTPSMASMLTAEAETEEQVKTAKGACASAYAAESDTSFATYDMFVAAMVLFPEKQRLAQAELDTVIGSDRLPTIKDKSALPYVTALMTEVFRWKPVVPLGVTHYSMEDDEYRGYHIPRRTVTIQNPWAYSRNPDVYPDPDEFIPERFLKDGQLALGDRDPGAFVFGYGRRICPGRHFAEELLFVTIATVLHCFTITGPRDEHGDPVKFELKLTNTSPLHPEPFDCTFTPRSSAAEALVRSSCAESELVGSP